MMHALFMCTIYYPNRIELITIASTYYIIWNNVIEYVNVNGLFKLHYHLMSKYFTSSIYFITFNFAKAKIVYILLLSLVYILAFTKIECLFPLEMKYIIIAINTMCYV